MKRIYYIPILIFLFTPAIINSTPLDENEIAAFFNNEVPAILSRSHIAGMTVSAVKNGNIIFKKGYGYADLERKKPVDPDATLFRAGSISKLFTWTAVMQLEEQGKLDLNADINQYLDFKIPDTFPEPITLAHLLTHKPGFEDRLINLFVKDPAKMMDLEKTVKSDILKRIRPAGEQISYSNYGSMLAGYIVQRVSGMPFEEYVEKHIFQPLKMQNSTIHQPLGTSFAENMSHGYTWDGTDFNLQKFEIVNGAPAGALSATASDMGKFMQAYLNPARNGLMKPETMRKMHSALFRPHDKINGMAHGFMELSLEPVRVIGHGGDTIYFHSLLFLIPEQNAGIFYSYNTGMEGGMSEMHTIVLYKKFMQTFFSGGHTGEELQIPAEDLSEYEGFYTSNRRSQSDITKIMGLFMTVKLEAAENGLLIPNFFTGKKDLYLRIDRDLFQEKNGFSRIFFRRDRSGHIRSLFHGEMPVMEFLRPGLMENPVVNLIVFLSALLFLITGFVARPTGLMAFFSGKITDAQRREAKFSFSVILIHLFFLIYLVYYLSSDFIFAGLPPAWPFFLPWVAFFAGLPVLRHAVLSWKGSGRKLPGKIYHSAFAIVMQFYFLFLWFWEIAY